MAVITISRLVGSKGTLIGKEVAKRMDYHYIDMEFVQKIMSEYGEINFQDIYDSKIHIWNKYIGIAGEMLEFFRKVMLSIAKLGNVVIIGRGSFINLGKYKDVLGVMIYAPIDIRIKAIMEIRGIKDPEEAENYIVKKEKIRQSFIENTFNVKWDKVNNFDMLFNTGKMNPDFVVNSIIIAGKELEKTTKSTQGIFTRDIESDKVLDYTVKSLLLE